MDTIAVLHYLPDPHVPHQARLAALEWYNDPLPDVEKEIQGVYGRSLLQLASERFGNLPHLPRCVTCNTDCPDTVMALQIWLERSARGITTAFSPANQDRWCCMACGKVSRQGDRSPLSAHQRMAILQATWARAPQAFGSAFLPPNAPVVA